jgi:hypothetical protein
MPTPKSRKSWTVTSLKNDRPRTQFRFKDLQHFNLVKKAVNRSGLSMNGWLSRVTLEAARREMKGE